MSRVQDALPDAGQHRRSSSRQIRHTTRVHLQAMARDDDAIEDAVLPVQCHDIGRKSSRRPLRAPQPGRRGGFKVWKTPFWKRRRRLWAERNALERQLIVDE
ncbi:MAG TPA: hypothetical protein VGH66_08360 [Acidimicrobiales bacterium]